MIYLAEVLAAVETLHLKYGVITRSDPLRSVAPVTFVCMGLACVAEKLHQKLSCRFLVECRYSAPSALQRSVSAGVMIKAPPSSLPFTVTGDGLYSVHLRIAKGKVSDFRHKLSKLSITFGGSHFRVAFCFSNSTDGSYSSYHPSSSLPLRLILGKPIYLEVLLHCSRPEAVLLINYCIAYPRSATNALVLLYDGYESAFVLKRWLSR